MNGEPSGVGKQWSPIKIELTSPDQHRYIFGECENGAPRLIAAPLDHVCTYCGASFDDKSKLVRHMVAHKVTANLNRRMKREENPSGGNVENFTRSATNYGKTSQYPMSDNRDRHSANRQLLVSVAANNLSYPESSSSSQVKAVEELFIPEYVSDASESDSDDCFIDEDNPEVRFWYGNADNISGNGYFPRSTAHKQNKFSPSLISSTVVKSADIGAGSSDFCSSVDDNRSIGRSDSTKLGQNFLSHFKSSEVLPLENFIDDGVLPSTSAVQSIDAQSPGIFNAADTQGFLTIRNNSSSSSSGGSSPVGFNLEKSAVDRSLAGRLENNPENSVSKAVDVAESQCDNNNCEKYVKIDWCNENGTKNQNNELKFESSRKTSYCECQYSHKKFIVSKNVKKENRGQNSNVENNEDSSHCNKEKDGKNYCENFKTVKCKNSKVHRSEKIISAIASDKIPRKKTDADRSKNQKIVNARLERKKQRSKNSQIAKAKDIIQNKIDSHQNRCQKFPKKRKKIASNHKEAGADVGCQNKLCGCSGQNHITLDEDFSLCNINLTNALPKKVKSTHKRKVALSVSKRGKFACRWCLKEFPFKSLLTSHLSCHKLNGKNSKTKVQKNLRKRRRAASISKCREMFLKEYRAFGREGVMTISI